MCIPPRCAETDSEQFLLDLYSTCIYMYALCFQGKLCTCICKTFSLTHIHVYIPSPEQCRQEPASSANQSPRQNCQSCTQTEKWFMHNTVHTAYIQTRTVNYNELLHLCFLWTGFEPADSIWYMLMRCRRKEGRKKQAVQTTKQHSTPKTDSHFSYEK